MKGYQPDRRNKQVRLLLLYELSIPVLMVKSWNALLGNFPAPGPNRQPIPAMFGNPGFPGAPGFQGQMPQTMAGGPIAGALGAIGNPTRQSKRIYVGNIQLTCNEAGLAEFFNAKMKEMGFAVNMNGQPVTSVQINHEKSYAFVEVSFRLDHCNGSVLELN